MLALVVAALACEFTERAASMSHLVCFAFRAVLLLRALAPVIFDGVLASSGFVLRLGVISAVLTAPLIPSHHEQWHYRKPAPVEPVRQHKAKVEEQTCARGAARPRAVIQQQLLARAYVLCGDQ